MAVEQKSNLNEKYKKIAVACDAGKYAAEYSRDFVTMTSWYGIAIIIDIMCISKNNYISLIIIYYGQLYFTIM